MIRRTCFTLIIPQPTLWLFNFDTRPEQHKSQIHQRMLLRALLKSALFFALLCLVANSWCLSITSATSYRKHANLLGSEIDVGLFEVEFDEDIFVRESYGHCNMTCAELPTCLPCDYTDPDVCAGSRATDPTCPCPVGRTCDIQSVLQLNSSMTEWMDFGGQKLFKMFVNDACNFVNIDVVSSRGDPDIYVTTAELYDVQGMDGYLLSSERFGSDFILLCPTDPLINLGTAVILIDGTFSNGLKMANGTTYTLSTTSRALPFGTSTAPSTPCTASSPGHECLDDDVPKIASSPDIFHHFTYKVPKQCPVTVSIYSNVAIVTSLTNPFPEIGLGEDPSVLQIAYSLGDSRLVWSTCNNNDNMTLYVMVTDLGAGYGPPIVSVTSNPGWTFLRPITEYNPFHLSTALYNSARFVYGQTNFLCALDLTRDVSCANFWHVMPTQDPNPFYPRPFFSVADDRFLLLDVTEKPTNPLPNKYVVAVRLTYQSTLQSLPLNLVTNEQFESSNLLFNGMICDRNGNAFVGSTSFTPKQFQCDYSVFSTQKNLVVGLLGSQEAATGQDIINLRYELDTMASSGTFMACTELAGSLYTSKTIEDMSFTSQCTSFDDIAMFAVDPCCNTTISWQGPGCLPRTTAITATELESTNDAVIASQCYAPGCVNLFIADYANAVSRIDNRATGCLANIPERATYQGELKIPFFNCRDRYLGLDAQGVSCFDDSDCTGTKCNMLTHRCLYNIEDQFGAMLECSIASLDRFVVVAIEERYDIQSAASVGVEQNLAQWKQVMSRSDCGNDYESALPFRAHWEYINVLPSFSNPGCESYECLEPNCNVPFPCFFNDLFLWRPVATQVSACTADSMFCNWMECQDPSTCQSQCLDVALSNQFCGLCENEMDCIEITDLTSTAACSSSLGCILHNGTVISVSTAAECQQTMTCNTTCNGVECNEVSCATQSGVCADADVFGEGSCVFPHAPFYFPVGCSSTYDFAGWTLSTKIGCLDQHVANATQCQQLGGTWLRAPSTKAECDNIGYGCLETKFDDLYNGYQLFTFKSREQCEEIGATYKPIYDWIPGTWASGTTRQLQWRDRAYAPRYAIKPQTFDMMKLSEAVTDAVAAKYSFQVKTISQCRHSQKSELIGVLACSCADNGDKSEECFANYQLSASLAMQIACVGSSAYINLGAADVFIGQESVKTETGDGCLTLRLSIVSATEFRYTKEDLLATFLINTQTNQEWGVFNDNNAMFGKIASDAVTFKYDTGTISNAVICARIRDEIQYNVSDFTVLDIALGNTENKRVVPLEASTWRNETHYCGEIPVEIIGNPTDASNSVDVYIFIWRSTEWQDKSSSSLFSPAETALSIILIVTYAFNLGFCSFKEIIMIRNKMAGQVKFWIFACFGALSLVRCLYFILLLSGALQGNSDGIYVLVELPSVLYLSALSFYVIVWALSMRRTLDVSRATLYRSLKKIGIALNTSMYFVFVLLLILYETIPAEPAISCGGRLVVADIITRYTIATVYRIFISVLALLLGAGFLIYGIRATINLKDSTAKKGKQSMRTVVFRTTVICSIGMLLQCAFMLALLFSGYQNNILSMVLLLLIEVGPITTMGAFTTTKHVATSATTKTNMDSSLPKRGTTTHSDVHDDTSVAN